MPPLESSWERRRLRAPRNDGEVLAIPPLADMPDVIARNREQIAAWDVRVLGKPLTELRRLARDEVLTLANQFVGQVSNLPENAWQVENLPHVPLIVSGHQPELFHRGVWVKNFVLDRLAKETSGISLHLIVDNDAVSSTRIAVPVGSREVPCIEFIPFDVDAGAAPWEEARLQDESLFRTFADRVTTALACWPIRPMLSDLWPSAIERLPPIAHAVSVPPPRLSDLLTIVRREAEHRLGLNNLELPVSQLCETESFSCFVCHLLSDPQQTNTIYNEVVTEYRRIHRVRNRQHPVPNLGLREGEWFESPFWIWRTHDTHRGRLFVRVTSSGLQLANGETIVATLPRIDGDSAESAVSQLRTLSATGWKLRPRAITNTLFARVFFADAFLHGIGGANYDEMTDRLIERLFGITPPSYLTVTATHRLPLGGWNVTAADVATLKHRLWDFDHNPEKWICDTTHLSSSERRQNPVARASLRRNSTHDDSQALKGGQEADRNESNVVRLHNNERTQTAGSQPRNDSVNTSWLTNDASFEPIHSFDANPEIESLLTEKQRLTAEQHTQDALDRHDPRRFNHAENDRRRRRFKVINHRLATLAHEVRSTISNELQTAQTRFAANTILHSREFSLGLFSRIQQDI